ncbi:TRAP transporter small permease [Alkalihalobacillus deserti]|jgi:TRAP-type C4-dicarboxylate transport system permease small subunit|uniref:TRAP transporter small permease n=1 Tax=Alkalihalobacillus deserti TaxID=2879466 RepID=UPI001D141931|nr:TRAP transporter small permease [Alkalihalobacillus deserti]
MKVLHWLDKNIESFILIVLSILTVVVVFVQVFMRYILDSSLVWSEELARYAFIWLIYIGVSFGVKKQAHIKVDAFALLFKRKGQLVLGICANLTFLIFAVLLAYYSFEVVANVTRSSPAMNIPMQWVYAAPMVGLLLTAIRIIQQMKIQIQTYKSEE